MPMSNEEPSSAQPHPASPSGVEMANISRRIVQLHKEFYGKGPTKARTYLQDDMVMVLMRGGFTRVEATLLREGRGDAVTRQRGEFHAVMLDRFTEVIEQELGRKVVAFMSAAHQGPDLLAEIFVLESEHFSLEADPPPDPAEGQGRS